MHLQFVPQSYLLFPHWINLPWLFQKQELWYFLALMTNLIQNIPFVCHLLIFIGVEPHYCFYDKLTQIFPYCMFCGDVDVFTSNWEYIYIQAEIDIIIMYCLL